MQVRECGTCLTTGAVLPQGLDSWPAWLWVRRLSASSTTDCKASLESSDSAGVLNLEDWELLSPQWCPVLGHFCPQPCPSTYRSDWWYLAVESGGQVLGALGFGGLQKASGVLQFTQFPFSAPHPFAFLLWFPLLILEQNSCLLSFPGSLMEWQSSLAVVLGCFYCQQAAS